MSKYDGGPAFPVHGGYHPDDDPRNRIMGGGMTLRDWFAGQVLQGLYGGPIEVGLISFDAKLAYQIADAMLEERMK